MLPQGAEQDGHGVGGRWSRGGSGRHSGTESHPGVPPPLGDIVFDYDGCDFEPAPGDKVLILVIAKSWNGQPKVKRIACPAKGSKLDK